jgi:acetolactate synthase-1/2/3 large subunit
LTDIVPFAPFLPGLEIQKQTMGYGLPSAVGAKVAAPEKVVVDIDGDASFSMTAMEMATASQYDIGVKILVLNNEFQGMVLQWQGVYRYPS